MTPDEISAHLNTQNLGRPCIVMASTSSTMDEVVRAEAQGADHGLCIVAETQSAGRGTHGRTWSSPRGKDLYFSVLLRSESLRLDAHRTGLLSLACGLGIRDALAHALRTTPPCPRVQVKWPNDVLINTKKTCGILIESSSQGGDVTHFIVGVGINVNRKQWPKELTPLATSLRAATGVEYDRSILLASALNALESRLVALSRDNSGDHLRDAIHPHLAYLGESVRCGKTTGEFIGLDKSGAAMISTKGKTHAHHSGRLEPLTR